MFPQQTMDMDDATGNSAMKSSVPHRRNACIPCTKAKRRCSKELPFCQRCLDKEVTCHYPSTRPYARSYARQAARQARATGSLSLESGDEPHAPQPGPTEDANAPSGIGFENDYLMSNELSALELYEWLDENYGGKGGTQGPASSWFLQSESWTIRDHDHNTTPHVPLSRLRQYTHYIRRWLEQWVEKSHCPFIHERLFADTGLPPCLQDAYAALTVYAVKNQRNEDIVMQFIEDKANALLREYDNIMSASPLPTIQLLAMVQAFFIYQFIRLFDGDIRQRSQAEGHISTLKKWIKQLWESTNLDTSLQTAFGNDFFLQGHSDATMKLWRSWILAESVRRTWMIGNYTQCIYLTLRDGEAICEGSLTFTARQGLWDATSAATWLRVLENQDPLFVYSNQIDQILGANAALDIDVFALSTMCIMMDSDKVDSWVAESSGKDVEALLEP